MLISVLAAFAGSPQAIEVTYTATFDLDQRGDQICGFTKFCDCTSTYVGSGTLHEAEEGRVTFKGTWKLTSNTCSDTLKVWVPADGAAYHTLRYAGSTASEWIVHRDPAGHVRLSSGMKASGQYWINELAAPWPTQGITSNQRDGTTLAMGVKLDATHALSIRLK